MAHFIKKFFFIFFSWMLLAQTVRSHACAQAHSHNQQNFNTEKIIQKHPFHQQQNFHEQFTSNCNFCILSVQTLKLPIETVLACYIPSPMVLKILTFNQTLRTLHARKIYFTSFSIPPPYSFIS